MLKNLSSVNSEFRNVLVSYIFPSFVNLVEVDHTHWQRTSRNKIYGNLSSIDLSSPHEMGALKARMPLSKKGLTIPSITSLIIDHDMSGTPLLLISLTALLILYNITRTPLLRDPFPVNDSRSGREPQAFFGKLVHLKLTSAYYLRSVRESGARFGSTPWCR